MKWVKWNCSGCDRVNYSRTPELPPPAVILSECLVCGGGGDGSWEERQSPETTAASDEISWQCPFCKHPNESPAQRAGATLEVCAKCHRECGVLWIGTWDGPLGAFDV